MWAKLVARSVANNLIRANSIAKDADGDLYITGWFNNSIILGTQQITSAGFADIFVAKFDPTGNFLWTNRVGNEWNDYPQKMFVDKFGNCLITGSYIGVNNKSFARITKISTSGQMIWSDELGSEYYHGARGIAIAADSKNNCYVAIASYNDILLRKYSSAGAPVWTKEIARSVTITDIALDNLGNCYLSGNFVGSSIIGTLSFESANYTSDILITKFDSSGSVIWAKASSGLGDEESSGLSVDGCGNAYITGKFYDKAIIGDITLIGKNSNSDVFVLKYDASGNPLWAKEVGVFADDLSNSISIDELGNCYLTAFLEVPFGTAQADANRYLIKVGTPGLNDCSISGKDANIWHGAVNSVWETGFNWSCSGKVPDANTDVIINSGNVILNSNTTVRSVTISKGATLTVKPGYKLTVTGK